MKEIIDNKLGQKLFGNKFELIVHGASEGQYNMDFDFDRTKQVAEGNELPMFRLYAWDPWTVSLGAHQRENELDEEKISNMGFGLVRRPTGGRAVFHANELTYSVVMKLSQGKSVHDIYREIHETLVGSFFKIGATGIEFEKSQPNFKEFYRDNSFSVSCFASSARYEITYEGRKIIGSAQRLFGDVLLQHGSIILGDGHEMLSEFSKIEKSEKKAALKKYIISHSSSLSESCGRKISYDECAEAIIRTLKG
jgi:lipoyl(octanoyl) transferase